jgi:hypothetical protein
LIVVEAKICYTNDVGGFITGDIGAAICDGVDKVKGGIGVVKGAAADTDI